LLLRLLSVDLTFLGFLYHHFLLCTKTSINVEMCSDEESDTTTTSNRLCHIVDGSLSISYSRTTTTTTEIKTEVTSNLLSVFEDYPALLPDTQPNIVGVSLITPITTTPPDYLLSNTTGRKIVSPSTIVSFCAGLFASISLLYFAARRHRSRGDRLVDDQNKRPDGGNCTPTPTPRRFLRRIGIISPRGQLAYLDLDDDNVLPDSFGSAMESGVQPIAFNFEPVLAATTSTESESMTLSVEPSTDATVPSLQSPSSSDSSNAFDDLPEDDSRSYGSTDHDYSVVGDGDLSTIYEEPTFSFSTSF